MESTEGLEGQEFALGHTQLQVGKEDARFMDDWFPLTPAF